MPHKWVTWVAVVQGVGCASVPPPQSEVNSATISYDEAARRINDCRLGSWNWEQGGFRGVPGRYKCWQEARCDTRELMTDPHNPGDGGASLTCDREDCICTIVLDAANSAAPDRTAEYAFTLADPCSGGDQAKVIELMRTRCRIRFRSAAPTE